MADELLGLCKAYVDEFPQGPRNEDELDRFLAEAEALILSRPQLAKMAEDTSPTPAAPDNTPAGVAQSIDTVIGHILGERTTPKQREALGSAVERGNRVSSKSDAAVGRATAGR